MIRLISTRPGTASGPSRDDRPDGPVVMLDLLTFKDRADDPQGHPDAGISGREACARYERPFIETAGAVSLLQCGASKATERLPCRPCDRGDDGRAACAR